MSNNYQNIILAKALRIESSGINFKDNFYTAELINGMTHQERCDYIKRFNKHLIYRLVFLLIISFAAYLYLESRPTVERIESVAVYGMSEIITKIDIHHSTFSTDTTVTAFSNMK